MDALQRLLDGNALVEDHLIIAEFDQAFYDSLNTGDFKEDYSFTPKVDILQDTSPRKKSDWELEVEELEKLFFEGSQKLHPEKPHQKNNDKASSSKLESLYANTIREPLSFKEILNPTMKPRRMN